MQALSLCTYLIDKILWKIDNKHNNYWKAGKKGGGVNRQVLIFIPELCNLSNFVNNGQMNLWKNQSIQ